MNFMMEPMRSLSLPIAGVEGGRAEFISPEKAMKKRFLVLVAMVALFVLGLSGAALAAGIMLKPMFRGTGYSLDQRNQGDFGSNVYVVEPVVE